MRMSPRLKARRGRFGPGGLSGPRLTITFPANNAIMTGSPAVPFTATSFDDLDGDISASIQWLVGTGSPAAIEATGASVDLSAFITATGSPVGITENIVTAFSTDAGGQQSVAVISIFR